MRFTDEQKLVIDSRDTNLLVSAAAGSGKTAVLSSRIISLLTDEKDPADIDRCLIVTFTRAAAAEMRERIGKAISEYCSEHPEDRRMERQGALLNNAQITTIDSFCLFVVKNNFSDIDLDPGFRILDEGERTLMLSDCLKDLLKEKYEEGDADFLMFMDSYTSGVKDSNAEKMILELLQNALGDPDPELWLERAAADIAPADENGVNESSWYKWGMKKTDILIAEMSDLTEQVLRLCASDEKIPSCYRECASAIRTMGEMLLDNKGYERRQQILSAFSAPALRGKKNDVDPETLKRLDTLIADAKILKKQMEVFYSADPDVMKEEGEVLGKNASVLCRLCLELKQRFDEKKRDSGVMDFNDMEHFALKILLDENRKPARAALEYRDHFEHIFVDEYQDSNYVQEYILKSIARDDNYFCVGDVKQSIYSFRQARPELFMEKYREYGEKKGGTRIDLNRNFRSRSQVIDFVNHVFETIMREETAGMDYDDDAKLYTGADYYDPPAAKEYSPEILAVYTEESAADPSEDDSTEEDDLWDDEDEQGGSREETEARCVAERIRKLKAEGLKVFDKELGYNRELGYGDIVLLASSLKPYEKALRKVFSEYDIPLYLNASTGYFNASEVKCLVAALRVIDNPRQDKPLHCVLVSFLELLTDDELALLRKPDGRESLYELIKEASEKEGETAEKIRIFFDWLSRYRKYARYMKVRELIGILLSESGYLDRVSALPGGAGRRANLKLLMERAADYEQTTYRGLFHFVRYLSLLKKQEIESGEATLPDASMDMVRCMTIHKSKGLEFPVVICLGLYRKFNKKGRSAAVMTDAVLGIGMDGIDPVSRLKYPGLKRRYLMEKRKDDELAENMRKLYVALTRAREKLIITDIRKEERVPASAPAAGYIIRKADSLLDLVYTGLDNAGVSAEHTLHIDKERPSAGAGKELKRAFGDRDLLIGDGIPVDEGLKKRMIELSEQCYSHPFLKGLYTKTSVSELKHAAYEDEEAKPQFETDEKHPYIPAFADASEKTGGTLRGSAYHRFLELVDHRAYPESDVSEWIKKSIEEMTVSGRLSAEYAGLISTKAMEAFMVHDECRRIREAAADGRLWREQPFFMAIPANELKETFPGDENVIIQGIIDAFWQEGSELVLLDYKTDRVSEAEELKKRYSVQLDLYSRALSQIKGMKVKEKLIYSFALDRFIYL